MECGVLIDGNDSKNDVLKQTIGVIEEFYSQKGLVFIQGISDADFARGTRFRHRVFMPPIYDFSIVPARRLKDQILYAKLNSEYLGNEILELGDVLNDADFPQGRAVIRGEVFAVYFDILRASPEAKRAERNEFVEYARNHKNASTNF